MQYIRFSDPHWLITFPNYIELQEEEWLLGLLLRCDEANGWFSGTTATYVARLTTGPQTLGRPALFVLASFFELPLLAERLAVTPDEIFATTFTPSLQILYAPAAPNVAQLGPIPPFRVCPECVAQDQLLHRSLALPGIEYCPIHHLVLQTACRCGSPLRPFARHTNPFTCRGCGLRWSELPRLLAEPASLQVEAQLYALYQFLLAQETPEMIAEALRLLRASRLKGAEQKTTMLERNPLFRSTYYSGTVSLAFLVANLVGRGFTVEYLAHHAQSRPKMDLSCLNLACPLFGVKGSNNVHLYGHRDGVQEWYCSICGSRFIGDHLCMSFDPGCHSQQNADMYLSLEAVERAQQRLARWKQKLEETCEAMLARGEPIAVENAFAHAGIPGTANLRATRLGLVEMVARYAECQQRSLALYGQERWAVQTHMHRRKKRPEQPGAMAAETAVGV